MKSRYLHYGILDYPYIKLSTVSNVCTLQIDILRHSDTFYLPLEGYLTMVTDVQIEDYFTIVADVRLEDYITIKTDVRLHGYLTIVADVRPEPYLTILTGVRHEGYLIIVTDLRLKLSFYSEQCPT